MNKFQKRISKNIKKSPIHCVVVGNGFGHIEDFLGLFDTVFLLESSLDMKAKNLIQREEISGVFNLRDIGGVFIDRERVHVIDYLSPLLSKVNPDVFIEGDDVIERQYSKVLYQLKYRAVAQLGQCHQWSVMP
jgi:hypothetical protein